MNNDELMHYGVKGMKWGVRRAQKKQAKATYKKAKADARTKRESDISRADAAYAKAMSKQNKGLKKVDDDYAAKQKTTDAHYEREISQHQKKVDSAKSDMDFWADDPDSFLYKEAKSKYDEHAKNLYDAQSRYNAVTVANKLARDQAAIKVRDLNYKTSEKASATREAAYAKAGSDYANSLNLAKQTYKEAKRNIKK